MERKKVKCDESLFFNEIGCILDINILIDRLIVARDEKKCTNYMIESEDDSILFTVFSYRDETDKELKEREDKLKRFEELVKQDELKQLERLKAKYES